MSLPFPIPSVVVWGILIIQAIALIALYRRWRASQANQTSTVKVKPTGHSAFVEGLIPVAIGIGFFALATIAAYSFAYDQAQALLLGKGTTGDIILVVIAGFLGLLNGIATSVAAVRWRIHTIRKDPEESFYHAAALRMFWLCFGVESLTLNYFLYRLTPESYPTWMGAVIDFVHASMSISRGILIPLDLAFLAAFLADLIITLSDRKRAIRVFTGQRMTLFEQRLTDDQHPIPADQAEELLNTYAGMQALNEFASDASDDEKKANAELFAKLCGAKGVVAKATMDGFVQQDHLQALEAKIAELTSSLTNLDGRVQTVDPGHIETLFTQWAETMKGQVLSAVHDILDARLSANDDVHDDAVLLNSSASSSRQRVHQAPLNILPPASDPRFDEIFGEALTRVRSQGQPLTSEAVIKALNTMGYQSPDQVVLDTTLERLQTGARRSNRRRS